MKDLLLKQAKVLDPGGPYNNKTVDILVRKGHIEKIGARIPNGKAEVIRSKHLHVSIGWFDTSAHFRDPGFEQKETITTGLNAAAAGGFTKVAVLPSTSPFTDSKAGIQYLLNAAKEHRVHLLPIGGLSKAGKGEQLAELYDMHQHGAIGFTDDSEISNTRLLMLGLQYQSRFKSTLVTYPCDPDLAANGQMHEGPMSVRFGMKGIPAIAEEIQLARDLRIQSYTGGRLHVGTISTAGSVQLIREAKKNGAYVTCSVAAHNLILDDSNPGTFDSRFKVKPPLRSMHHIEALVMGLKEGTIDSVCSDHRPEDIEHKMLEFDQAAFGATSIEHAFSAAHTALQGQLKTNKIVERFAQGPRKVFGLPIPKIKVGEKAELTYFDTQETYVAKSQHSKGVASPFEGMELQGKVLGVIC